MRFESSVTAISWIPSEAVEGMPKLPFSVGVAHYDEPPPDEIADLVAMCEADAFREANELRAFIEVEDGKIVDNGHLGRGHMGVTTVKLGRREISVPGVAMPTLQPEPTVSDSWVRFTQTAGGRTGLPTPRHVHGKPFFQISCALAWTTLSLTLYADGGAEHELVGASTFPRHWIYRDGKLVDKSGLIDFKEWYRKAFGENTPWGEEDSEPFVTQVETALERQLSQTIMKSGTASKPRRLDIDDTLVSQGEAGDEVYLLLDGVLTAEVNGETVAEVGPGAVLGERSVVEGVGRTATLRAVTPAKVVAIPAHELDSGALQELASGRRREEYPV
jgi:Cyclic nucleotide-binding domain